MPLVRSRLDPRLPWLEAALDPAVVERDLLCTVRDHTAIPDQVRLAAASIIRHKPGRRCLIRYRLAAPDGTWQLSVLGKMRARGLDRRTVALHTALATTPLRWDGPGPANVPPVLGTIPALNLWLQGEAPGIPGALALDGPHGAEASYRIGQALATFHRFAPAVDRRHDPTRELAILDKQLSRLASVTSEYGPIAKELRSGAARIVDQLPSGCPATIHRDFYPDQLLVRPDRITLLDLDLATRGDPALDIGNCCAHLIEADLRRHGAEGPLTALRAPLLAGYRAAESIDEATVHRYETLALIRHVAISQRIPSRAQATPHLVKCCRNRLGHTP